MGGAILSRLFECAVGAALCAQPSGGPQVVVRTVDHERLIGELEQFNIDASLVLRLQADDERITIAPADVVHIARLNAQPTAPMRCCVILHDGDKLCGRIADGASEQVVLDTILRKGIAVPLDGVRAYLTEQAAAKQWQPAVRRLLESRGDADQALLLNGDSLSGLVVGIGEDKLTFEHDDRPVHIDYDRLVAIVMAMGAPPARSDAVRAKVRFVDGSILSVSRLDWSGRGLELTFFDGSLQGLSPEVIQSVEMLGTRWTWLSDLQPLSSEHTPALSRGLPHRVDRNVLGGSLSVAGRTYERGLGVHSRSVLRFTLGGQYRQFTTLCGLDDSAGELADVTASIVVDGESKWRQEHVRAGSPAAPVRIDVSRARILELRVDFGDNCDVQDRFNWADAALIR